MTLQFFEFSDPRIDRAEKVSYAVQTHLSALCALWEAEIRKKLNLSRRRQVMAEKEKTYSVVKCPKCGRTAIDFGDHILCNNYPQACGRIDK